MHILLLTMIYTPDRTGIAPLTTELCEYLTAHGHKVSVITTFPHYPEWKIREDYKDKLWLRETIGGVDVYRGWVYLPPERTSLNRIIYDTTFAVSSLLWGLQIPDVDVILALTPPLQAGVTASILGKIKGAPLVLQVQDLLPDLAVALGMLRNKFAIKCASLMEKYLYRKASAVTVVCQGFLDNIKRKGVPESKLLLIPNWVDTAFIRPTDRNGKFRAQFNLTEDQFLVLHTGNMGAKQKLTVALDAAAKLQDHKRVLFLLVGDGIEKSALEEYARRRRLRNVRFLPLQPREQLPEMLSAADVLLLNQSAAVVDMVIPSKLLMYMSAGRAIVAGVNPSSEAADCIRRAGCGVVVPPEDADALAKATHDIYCNPERAERAGKNGRAFAERHFAQEAILGRCEDLLLQIAQISREKQATAHRAP